MTTQDLTWAALPYARHALNEARPEIMDAVGNAGWFVLWPAWGVVTGPMLPLVVRIAIELAVGLLGPKLVPILESINAGSIPGADIGLSESSRAFLVDLTGVLTMSREPLSDPVRSALVVATGGGQPS